LETQIQNAMQTLERYKQASLESQKEIDVLREELVKITEKVAKKKEENKELDTQLEQLKSIVETTKSEIDSTKNKLAPKSELKEKKEYRNMRTNNSELEQRLQNDEKNNKNLQLSFEEFLKANAKLTEELESYKNAMEQAAKDRPKNLFVDTAAKPNNLPLDDSPTNSPIGSVSMFGSLRRSLSKRRSTKVESVLNIHNSGSLDSAVYPHINAPEGYLKTPKKEGNLRYGWVKRYIMLKDYQLYAFEKEKDRSLGDGKLIIDLRASIFSCREATEAEIHAKPDEMLAIFLIQTKSGTVVAASDIAESNLSPVQIEAKIKAIEKEIEIEEGIFKGIEKMAKISSQKKEVDQQMAGSRKKMEQLKQHLTKLRSQLEEAGNQRSKQIQLAEELVTSERNYKEDLKKLLEVAENEEKASVQQKLQESEAKLIELEKALEQAKNAENQINQLAMGDELQYREFNGHRFRSKVYEYDTLCQFCSKLLINYQQGFQCSVCDYICHKECHTLGNLSCSDRLNLKNAPPFFFMAADQEERKRWVELINISRDNYVQGLSSSHRDRLDSNSSSSSPISTTSNN